MDLLIAEIERVAERLTAGPDTDGALGVSFLAAARMCSRIVSEAKPQIKPTSTDAFGVSG